MKLRISAGVASVRSADRSSKSVVVSLVVVVGGGCCIGSAGGTQAVRVDWTYHLGRPLGG